MARGEFPFYCNISEISFDKFFESSNGDATTNIQIAHSY